MVAPLQNSISNVGLAMTCDGAVEVTVLLGGWLRLPQPAAHRPA